MRIPFKHSVSILKTGSFNFQLVFEKRFFTKETVISLGCNCHPAHTLDSMRFRTQSMPFDWLLTDGVMGVEYVCDNIKNEFKYYTRDLKKDENNNVYASRYKYSVFFQHANAHTDNKVVEILNKRAARFLNVFKTKPCVFLYCAPAASFTSNESAQKLKASVDELMTIIKPEDRLLVYITCDESLDENKIYCNLLLSELNKINRVRCAKFLLEAKKYGLWGYANNYSLLFKELSLNIRSGFPKLSFKKVPVSKD
ncbi:MAG: DUF1796 family putative cysteine peptidase [Bacteroidia bacterium]